VSGTDATAPASLWSDRHAEICRRHRNVVAVYESAAGRYALLLADTLVPLGDEHRAWLRSTRTTARAIARDLRAAGLGRHFFVLQWWPLEQLAQVFERWACRYDGDPARRAQHMRVVAGQLADRRFLCSQWVGQAAPAARRRALTSIA
jgi:hypothetical protein